jgi:hypothetical protein
MPPTNQPSAENVARAREIAENLDVGYGNQLDRVSIDLATADIAQALQDVEDAAERRGAVKWLRSKAIDTDGQADCASTEFEFDMLRRVAAILFSMADELEAAATKEEPQCA